MQLVIKILIFAFTVTNANAANSIALSTIDLAAARKCATWSNEWKALLPPKALDLIVSSRHMVVTVDDTDTWHFSSLEMQQNELKGDEGDYDKVNAALSNELFRMVRCAILTLASNSHLDLPTFNDCDIPSILAFAFEQANEDERQGLTDWIGGEFVAHPEWLDHLIPQAFPQDPSSLSVVRREQILGYAHSATETYVQAEFERQQSAIQLAMTETAVLNALPNNLYSMEYTVFKQGEILIAGIGDKNAIIPLKAGADRIYLIPLNAVQVDVPNAFRLHNDDRLFKAFWGDVGTQSLEELRINETLRQNFNQAIRHSMPQNAQKP